ncbi:Ig-like domain-containing protein [Deinococcus sp. Leaf326]|uniref:Ig-like domain-containing protein n=1 Tax=Deinococcus sp. Leaf326 TaxID=1736338 RepID=UPI0006F513AB|nr:Ig-like domain-containing protein [Deinococcus sp. Leaf326]KQR15658.1 peptidase-like protein [Deinococcus sp. Leaf326]
MRRVQTLSVLALTGALLSACSTTGTVSGDTTKPAVSLSATPTTLSGAGTVSLVATATDNVGVKSVTFYRGDTRLAEDTTSPYEYSDSVSATSGTLTYRAVAVDAAGNASDAATATVTVTAPSTGTPPTVSATVTQATPGQVVVTADAKDDQGVTKVEFYEGDKLLSTSTASPYTAAVSYTAAQNGSHTVTVKAYDAQNNVATTTVTFTVAVPVPANDAPPSVALASSNTPLNRPGTLTFTADAKDDLGIARVEFYLDGALINTAATAPYTASIQLAPLENSTHTVTVRAYDTSGQMATAAQTFTVGVFDAANDSVASAFALSLGTPQNGTIAGQSRDMDYFKYTATAGEMLKLTVKSVSVNPSSTLDPYVMILMPDGKTVLEKDDDGGAGLESEIRFNAPVSGTYTVVVTSFIIHDDPNATDDKPTNTYQIALTRR